MFFDLARILRAKQPRLFVFENVKGLLSHDNGQTFATIIATIDELGYDAQWQVVNSKDFGVPQNRERIIIVGHLRGTARPQVFPISPTSQPYTQKLSATAIDANYWKGIDNHGQRTAISQENPVRVGTLRTHKDGNGFREMKSGNAPTIPARAREDGSGQPVIYVPEATQKGYAEASVGDSINFTQPNSKTRRGRVGKGIANTVTAQGIVQHTLMADATIRRLTPVECERLQGFPDDWTKYGYWLGPVNLAGATADTSELISDTQRYKMCGNAVTTNVIQAVFSRILV